MALPYEPNLWVDFQWTTNCYDYACNNRPNRPKYSKSTPGAASNRPVFEPLTCDNVAAAAVSDGLIAQVNGQPVGRHTDCGFNCWKVALMISEASDDTENDYHWLRQDAVSGWSHKRDHFVVNDLNASGHPIRDPENADLDFRNATNGVRRSPHNYKFCRYMCVCPPVNIASVREPRGESHERYMLRPEVPPLRITLTEAARLSGAGMDIHLPRGEIEIRYLAGEMKHSLTERLALPVTAVMRKLMHSGREDPAWPLAPEDAAELGTRVAKLDKRADAPYVAEPRFCVNDLPSSRGTIPFIGAGAGLVAVFDQHGTQRIYQDTTAIEECLTLLASRHAVSG